MAVEWPSNRSLIAVVTAGLPLLLTWRVGVSGNVLIDNNADRLNTYTVWNYAEGNDSYYSVMTVDLTQPPSEVSDLLWVGSRSGGSENPCTMCFNKCPPPPFSCNSVTNHRR